MPKKKKSEEQIVARAISSFVPAQVYERIVRNPKSLDRVGERRAVTIVFVDIAGFTPLCEKRDAEEVMLLLNSLFMSIIEIVSKYGGTVDKFMGDAAMIVFGAPVAHEDDPIRALSSSLEIIDAVKRKFDLSVSIGVNTGEVVAGIVGDDSHREYTVLGDAVNVASRLQNSARAGEILVGPETYLKTKNLFEFGPKIGLELKGKTKKVYGRILIRKKESETKRETVKPFLRTAELRKLEKSLLAGKNAIYIVGEQGTGKSVLLGEFIDLARKTDFKTIEFQALQWGENIPYHPLHKFIRELLGDNPQSRLSKIAPGSEDYLPLLSGILGKDFPDTEQTKYLSPIEKNRELRQILKGLIYGFSKKQIIVSIDSYENADPSTMELFSELIMERRCPVVISGRILPTVKNKNISIIALKNLDEGKVSLLLREALGARILPAKLVKDVFRETAGNPRYIIELLSLLKNRGFIVSGKGDFRELEEAISKIPKDISGIILARMDSLPPDARETLRTASVLGSQFDKRIIERILGENVAMKGLSQLEKRGILDSKNGDIVFSDTLLLKTAYNSLFITSRKKLHAISAKNIEKLFAKEIESQLENLASHYEFAGIHEKAFHFQILAGKKQERYFANREALHYYQKALAVDDETAIKWGAWLELFSAIESAGKLFWYSGELVKVVELNERALRLAERMRDRERMIDSLNRIALAYQELGDFHSAKSKYENQLKMLEKIEGQKERILQALTNLGTLYSDLGDLSHAERTYRKGLMLVGEDESSPGAANLLGNLAWLEIQKGNLISAEEHLRRSFKIDEALGNIRGLAINSLNQAQIHKARKNNELERECYVSALELFRRIGDKRGEALCLSNIGDTLRQSGKIKEARAHHRKALAISEAVHDRQRIIDAELGLALDDFEECRFKPAIARAREAFKIAKKIGDWEGEIETGLRLIEIFKKLKDNKSMAKVAREIKNTIEKNNPSAMERLNDILTDQ